MSKSVERRLAHQKKNKLEELGALENYAINRQYCAHMKVEYKRIEVGGGLCRASWLCRDCGTPFVPQAATLVESLTTERDALKKRVEELERELDTFVPELQDANRAYGKQLQAARELALMLKQIEDDAENSGCEWPELPWTRIQLFDLRTKARDFLRMLEDSHAA